MSNGKLQLSFYNPLSPSTLKNPTDRHCLNVKPPTKQTYDYLTFSKSGRNVWLQTLTSLESDTRVHVLRLISLTPFTHFINGH